VIEGLSVGRMESKYTAETLVSPSTSAGCGGRIAPDVFTTPERSHGPRLPRCQPGAYKELLGLGRDRLANMRAFVWDARPQN
jgi:hypothetical protein